MKLVDPPDPLTNSTTCHSLIFRRILIVSLSTSIFSLRQVEVVSHPHFSTCCNVEKQAKGPSRKIPHHTNIGTYLAAANKSAVIIFPSTLQLHRSNSTNNHQQWTMRIHPKRLPPDRLQPVTRGATGPPSAGVNRKLTAIQHNHRQCRQNPRQSKTNLPLL